MTMFCDCGNPEAHRGEHIPKPVTDTPLDLDYIEDRVASPMVTYRENVEEGMPALVAALTAERAKVAALWAQQNELAVEVGDLTRSEQAYYDRAMTAEAKVAAVLALPGREWSEDHADSPESRAARAYNSALLAARRAITGGTDEG